MTDGRAPGPGSDFASPGHLLDMARSGHVGHGPWSRRSASASSTAVGSRTRRSAKGRRSSSAGAGSPTSRRSGPIRAARSFFEELAENHRVVRYDRLGVGPLRPCPGPRPPTARGRRAAARTPCSTRAATRRRRLRVLLLRARNSPIRERRTRPRGAGRLLGRVRRARRHPRRDPALDRRSDAGQLAARGADDRRPARPARERGRDRRASAATCGGRPRRTSPPTSSSSTSRPMRARSSRA